MVKVIVTLLFFLTVGCGQAFRPHQQPSSVSSSLLSSGGGGSVLAEANSTGESVSFEESPSFQSETNSSEGASAARPTIVLKKKLAPLFGFGGNINHGWMTQNCGYLHKSDPAVGSCGDRQPFGAWADGPLNPYKYNGDTYFQIPHSENFRIKVPGHDWGNRGAWTMEGELMDGALMTPAQRSQLESHYNNRNWLFAVYNENNTLYGLTHHEWYKNSYSLSGVPGFKPTNDPWVASIGRVSSLDGGRTWNMDFLSSGARRLVAVPEPSPNNTINKTYGFMHPSNIVKEGSYYYSFVMTDSFSSNGSQREHGVILLRTTNLNQTTGWQYWNGNGWTTINHNTHLGNFGPQRPHIFWKDAVGCTGLYAMNVRQHTSGKWITLGSKYCLPRGANGQFKFQAVFSWTDSLSNPRNLEGNLAEVNQQGLSLPSNFYYSFFDPNSTDNNYQTIGDKVLLVVTKNYNEYYHHWLQLSGF